MRAFVCLALAMLCVPLAHAQAQAWAVDYDRLYRVDTTSRKATLIGAAGSIGGQPAADLSGLTMAPDGTLYAASDTLKALLRIDPATGRAQLVGRFGVSLGSDPTAPLDYAMTAACDGSLWLASATARELWKVDPGTAAATRIGPLGRSITGLVVKGDALYGMGGRGDEGWYRIDTKNGSASLIGGLGATVTYLASGSPAIGADGAVLAALNYVPPPRNEMPADWSDLATIDAATGATRVLGPITGPESLRGIGIRGFVIGRPACAATAPDPGAAAIAIPTLGTWLLILEGLALGALALVAVRRRRSPFNR